MKIDTQAQAKLLKELEKRKPNYSLPQPLYLDDDIFNADLDNLFYQEWLFIAHDCEIPESGDFFRYEIGNADVIILRDQDMGVRAFHNTCRHRGSSLCKEEKGNKAQLVCPYHQWTYDLTGKLKYAKDMGEDFNPSDHTLHSVNCETIEGMIYICLKNKAPDFSVFKQTIEPYLAPHNFQDAKVVHESNIIEEGNWKLVIENNRECYHCAGSHPELCRTYSDDPSITGIPDELDPTSQIVQQHWDKCDAIGIPARFHLSDDGQYRITRMPLHDGAESFTLHGKVASEKTMVLSDDKALGTLMFFHYPNTWNHLLSDHSITFRVTPISANKTMVTTKWLVHKDAVEGKDYDLESLTAVWNATNGQDLELVEENHRGIQSPNYQPGPYSVLHEDGVIQFVDWYKSISTTKAAGSVNNDIYIERLAESKLGVLSTAVEAEKVISFDLPSLSSSSTVSKQRTKLSSEQSTEFGSEQNRKQKTTQDNKKSTSPKVIKKSTSNEQGFDQNKIPYLYLDQNQPWEAQSALLELINIIPETHDVMTFSFRTPTNNWFSFAPGQFITLELPIDGETVYRTYTISSSPSRPLSLSITVKANAGSVGSQWMFDNLKVGMQLRAFGPVGEFNLYKYTADKYCFISGGSGITPMLSMTKYLFDRGGDADISFIHCAQSPKNIVAREEVERLSTRVPSIQVAWIVDELDPFSAWTGFTGRMNQLILELTTPDYAEREIFCCGPAMFMQAVRDILNTAGFDMSHYHEESFDKPVLDNENVTESDVEYDDVILDDQISTQVSFLNSKQSLESNQSISLLDTSLKAGLNIPSACQFGVCGTCKVKKVSGDVHMIHNGGISDKEIDEGYILACCSHPLTDVELLY